MFPSDLIRSRSIQKKMIDCTNGHRVLFRSYDDESKFRSLNLTAWWIEEASEVSYDIFVQLQTRLRNEHTEHHMGIMSTNPDMNWIKTEFLLKSKTIHNADVIYPQNPYDINDNFSTHIASSRLNTYLPPDYYETVAKGKADWWIRRYLEGSFENRQGLVYPMYSEHIVEPFEIPKHWERWISVDFGLTETSPSKIALIQGKPKCA